MSVVLSRRDLIEVTPEGSGRTYTVAPLTFRESVRARTDLVREIRGNPVTDAALMASRRAALEEINPPDKAEMLAVLDEFEADGMSAPSGEEEQEKSIARRTMLAARVGRIDSIAMAAPIYSDMVTRNMNWNGLFPLIWACHGLRAWSGAGLPVFPQGVVPIELMETLPDNEILAIGRAVETASRVAPDQEKNSEAPSPLPATGTPIAEVSTPGVAANG